MGLISLAYAQSRLPGVPPATLQALIEPASARFEKECSRSFAAADYRERVQVGLDGYAILKNFPALRVDRVAAGSELALTVRHASAVRARASVEPAGSPRGTDAPGILRLTAFAGLATTDEVAIAGCPTLSALAGAVNGHGGGWSATVADGRGGHPSDELITSPGADATGAGAELLAVAEDREAGFPSDRDREAGLLVVRAGERERVVVWYRAGFDPIPGDIQEAIVSMIASSLEPLAGAGGGLKRRKTGDVDREWFAYAETSAFPKSVRRTIGLYRDNRA